MCDDTGEHEDTQKGQRNDEQVEVTVVAFADTVTDPRAVVIEAFDTIVTQAAVRCARWPKDLTREAELELHHLVIDDDFLCSRRRPERRRVGSVRNFCHSRAEFKFAEKMDRQNCNHK